MVNDTIGTNSDVPSKSYIRQNYRIIINFTIRSYPHKTDFYILLFDRL